MELAVWIVQSNRTSPQVPLCIVLIRKYRLPWFTCNANGVPQA
jgi:hypothetical protein